MSSDTDPRPVATANNRAITLLASATVLALLYVGREVLVPITLSIILSLLIAPFIRGLRRIGLGHSTSVLIAVFVLAFFVTGLLGVIGSQVVHMAKSLPQYEATIRAKIRVLSTMTVDRMDAMQGEAGRFMDLFDERNSSSATVSATTGQLSTPSPSDTTALAHASRASSVAVITRILTTAWVPFETAGIVLVVLIFILLEHEALRDRFIRLAGGTDLRATTAAIDDAGERLSRFFVSQFAVNFGVGLMIWLGLVIIGLPNAPLWAIITAVLRFVPYVGVWLAATLASLLAAAVDPGWSIMLMTAGLFVVVEMIASQLVEPQLYGHATGLSSLAVVVAAIFWSWLWGPAGLILSTPLTLCLVVAGRHVKALNHLEILLGDTPALTMPQHFYQRALAGDAEEIIGSARSFLKRKSFAAYCDTILWPALQLARVDRAQGAISRTQQVKVRTTIGRAIEALASETTHKQSRWHRSAPVLDDSSLGRHLRRQRENVSGRWQGPLEVEPGSVALCISLGSIDDDLATEVLARILRDLNIDGRNLSTEDIEAFAAEPHPEATKDGISMVCIVNTAAAKERERSQSVALAQHMRQRFPEACIVAVVLLELLEAPELMPISPDVDKVAHSFEEAAQLAIARLPGRNQLAKSSVPE